MRHKQIKLFRRLFHGRSLRNASRFPLPHFFSVLSKKEIHGREGNYKDQDHHRRDEDNLGSCITGHGLSLKSEVQSFKHSTAQPVGLGLKTLDFRLWTWF